MSAVMLLLDALATYLAICACFVPCSALQVERQRPDRTAPASGEVLLMPWGRWEFELILQMWGFLMPSSPQLDP